ncbi:MAG: hypothetical protein M0P71_09370 [Melioribacteraceae bacterium]|nr:hypothetical protein [Melioribacteraceae bacterium]
MKWFYIDTGFNTGKYNMDFDMSLAQSCTNDIAFFRIYRWKPYCISLGANQIIADIQAEKAKADNIDIVTRPTGGRAILHAQEITYSVVYPYGKDFSPKELYSEISKALLEGLKIYDPILGEAELESVQPNFPALLKESSGSICFGSTAKNEAKFHGKKLIGSAQRKLNSTILQHGSILCGDYHKHLIDYLNIHESQLEHLRKEIDSKTIEIEEIVGYNTDYVRLIDSLKSGFENHFEILEPINSFIK